MEETEGGHTYDCIINRITLMYFPATMAEDMSPALGFKYSGTAKMTRPIIDAGYKKSEDKRAETTKET